MPNQYYEVGQKLKRNATTKTCNLRDHNETSYSKSLPLLLRFISFLVPMVNDGGSAIVLCRGPKAGRCL